MDVCGLAVHQVTYRDIWVRRVIIKIDSVMIPVMFFVMIPVMIPVTPVMPPVMTPDMTLVMTPVMDSCYSCFVLLL